LVTAAQHNNAVAAGYRKPLAWMPKLLAAAEQQRCLAFITEIALDCGFTNRSHLNRHFTKLTRISPKKYRDLPFGNTS
jgi:AraC-like DNA-binding protein